MKNIYLVPHSHYDAVWAFTKEDYFYINIEKILKPAIELMADPGYRFLIEQVALLEEIEHRNPSLFADIKKYAASGQLEIAGGEYLMSDTMLPGGETLVRQILVGKNYARDKLGIAELPVMWGADAFGFNAQMPQIYLKSGYRYFAFRRGATRSAPTEFWWQGLDGSRILAHWMPLGYRAGLFLNELPESFRQLEPVAATGNILMPSGSGSIPPQPETASVVRRWNRRHRDSRMMIARARDFFQALEQESDSLEVRIGEQYSGKYSRVFPHCTSSRMWLKQKQRHYEQKIISAEKWVTMGWLLGVPYPVDAFHDSWKKVLWGAFHDVAPGTGMDEGYEEAHHNYSYLDSHLSQVLIEFRELIQDNLTGAGDVIVFNPLSWPVRNWVEAELSFDRGVIRRIAGLASNGLDTEVEILESTRYSDDSYHTVRLGFVAEVPPFGYRTYSLVRNGLKPASRSRLKTRGNTIQNQFFKMDIDPGNGLIDLYLDGEHLCFGNELVVEEETGDLYYHRQNMTGDIRTESEAGVTFGRFRMKHFEIAKTPLRRVVRMESDYYSLIWPYRLQDKLRPVLWRHSYLSVSKTIIVYHDIPRIDFVTTIENRHPQMQLRLKFTTDIQAPEYTSEIQFGALSRSVNLVGEPAEPTDVERPSGIFPAQNWVDYSDNERGLTLINKGLPSHEVRDGAVYVTLLRSIMMLSSDGITGPAVPTPDAQEFKKYTYEYSVYPHRGDWRQARSYRAGHEVNTGLTAFQLQLSPHRRKILPEAFSFIEASPDNIIVSACKRAEDGSGVILRLYEAGGEETEAVIRMFHPVNGASAGIEPMENDLIRQPSAVRLVNLMEQDIGPVTHEQGRIVLEFKPFEIISLKLVF
ncbi:glycoside hydrolase family 38 [Dehalogenimonas lykanthroporepellens BL-DC-9]|nr:glycoside hydrolase family 38 [Dehalogenimonas lykanthroporepellens BL-DC-9]